MPELSPKREMNTTASQAPIICNGKPAQIYALWEERIGQKAPPDLSESLPVYLGTILEQPMLDWMQRKSGNEITERQRYVEHPTLPHISATLDGYRAVHDAIVEFKVPGPFRKRSEILTWYQPQLIVQMGCRQCNNGVLAILQGHEHILELEIVRNEEYEREVWERVTAFQICCETWSPPSTMPPLVAPELWRNVDLTVEQPNWGPDMINRLLQWSETREAARLHDQSKKDIKELLPEDVGLVTYGDFSVRKAKNRAVTVREKEFMP